MKQILFILTLFLLIPLSSYSQDTTQHLLINKYQIQSILKDKVRLNYLEKVSFEDAKIIQELEAQTFIYQQKEDDYKLLIDSKDKTIDRLRFQNRLVIIGASVVSGFLFYQAVK